MKSILNRPSLLAVFGGTVVVLLALSVFIPNLALVGGAAKNAHAVSANTAPTIVPSTTKVHPNQTITVTGTGFTPNETVGIFIDTTSYIATTLNCDNLGTCTGTLTFSNFPGLQGQHMLIAEGQPAETAKAPITILPAIFFSTNLSGYSQGGPGSITTLTGSSFQANETVSVYWGKGHSTLLGSATTDSTYGYFNYSLLIPTGITPGTYRIYVVTSGKSPLTLSTLFKVIPTSMTAQTGVRSGQTFNFSFAGFQGAETLHVSWNANGGQQIGTLQANGEGSGYSQASLVVPSAPKGQYTLTLTGQSSGLQNSAPVTVGPGIDLSAYNMVIPGGQVTVQGGGFSANEQVHVSIVGVTSASSQASVTTAADGSFQATINAPNSHKPNKLYDVVASNTSRSEIAKNRFYISFASVSFTNAQSNNTAIYGTPGTMSGSGFQGNEQVSLYWNYQQAGQIQLPTVQTASDGTFSASISVPSAPAQSTSNQVVIEAIGKRSTFQASTQVTIQAAIYVNPARGTAGQTVQVNVGMLQANTLMTLYFDTTSTVLGSVTTGNDGSFSSSFTIPANASSGLHTVFTTVSGGGHLVASYVIPVTVTLTPSQGSSGTSINIQAPGVWNPCNFLAPEAQIVWSDPTSGSYQDVKSVLCGNSSTLNTTITAPTGLIVGHTYEVQVFENSSLLGQASFTAQ